MSIRVSRRTSANLNGALIVMGLLGTVDNVIVHWTLGLHRLIEGSEYTLHAEIALVLASAVLLCTGLYRELSARKLNRSRKPQREDYGRSPTA